MRNVQRQEKYTEELVQKEVCKRKETERERKSNSVFKLIRFICRLPETLHVETTPLRTNQPRLINNNYYLTVYQDPSANQKSLPKQSSSRVNIQPLLPTLESPVLFSRPKRLPTFQVDEFPSDTAFRHSYISRSRLRYQQRIIASRRRHSRTAYRLTKTESTNRFSSAERETKRCVSLSRLIELYDEVETMFCLLCLANY